MFGVCRLLIGSVSVCKLSVCPLQVGHVVVPAMVKLPIMLESASRVET